MSTIDSNDFDLTHFFREVAKMMNNEIDQGISSFKHEIIATSKKKGFKDVTDASVLEACQRLSNKMKTEFNENMNRFETYVERNIFTLYLPSSSSNSSTSGKNNNQQEDEDNNDSLILEQEVEELKLKYGQIFEQYSTLSDECRQSDGLLKDMKKTLFDLKVGAQALDDSSLDEQSRLLSKYGNVLETLTNKAEDLDKEIKNELGLSTQDRNGASSKSSGDGPRRRHEGDEPDGGIETAGIADVQKLNALISNRNS